MTDTLVGTNADCSKLYFLFGNSGASFVGVTQAMGFEWVQVTDEFETPLLNEDGSPLMTLQAVEPVLADMIVEEYGKTFVIVENPAGTGSFTFQFLLEENMEAEESTQTITDYTVTVENGVVTGITPA